MPSLLEKAYNPDVLTCLANLSNDEVFTPPELANDVLDMLPPEIWSDPTIKILDPCCKSGVFLREAAKRFIKGLEHVYPDLHERVEHIMHEQLYGIAITELTSLLARRSLYCSKFPNGRFSVAEFDSSEGNVRHRTIQHTWVNNRCKYCGASNAEYDRDAALETYAYEFIHTDDPERILNMKFDVIVGNPPYQLSTAGVANGAQAKPIYQLFVDSAKKLKPRFLSMIIPARWFSGGWGLDDFRSNMLGDRHLRVLHDYFDSSECFPGVQIKGGVCYFLWDRDNPGDCTVISHTGPDADQMTRPLLEKGNNCFIRQNKAVSIYKKVQNVDGTAATFDSIVSAQKPFGIGTSFRGRDVKADSDLRVFQRGGFAYIARDDIPSKHTTLDTYKIFISAAYGAGDTFPHQILGKPFIGSPGECCTETYIAIGPLKSKKQATNALSFISSKTFRFLVMLNKPTQHALRKVYSLVPLLSFDKQWTDEELYARYGFDDKEIDFIESMIRPMDLGDGNE